MFYRRNSLRLKNFNYTKPCVYFITMCVNQHLCLFGEVNDRKLKLNAAGKMIANVFTNIRIYYKGTVLDTYIVMPNHFHGIIIIDHTVGASLCGRPYENIIGGELNLERNDYTITKNLKGRALRSTPTHHQLSLGEIIGRFKSYTTTQYISGVKNNKWKPFYEKLWQRGYYDHIVKDKKELFAIRKYIVDNPLHSEK